MTQISHPTLAVRQLMKAHGASTSLIFTNKYEKCRTVKCYLGQIDNLDQFKTNLLEMYTSLGYGCPQVYTTETSSKFRDTRALIVRIPKSLQQ